MEFKQLEVYVKVYQAQSFSKAAEQLFLSQPSISAYVSSLEKELNTLLLHRSNKEFLPTKTGKAFYNLAREMLASREKAIKSIKSLSDSSSGNIDIMASSVPAQYILPEILSDYHRLYPDVSFNIKQVDTKEVVSAISAGDIEIGFVGAKIEPSKCEYRLLINEKLVLIAPNEKRFEGVSQENIKDLLLSEYFIERESGSGTKQEYEECLQSIGIRPSELKVSACFNNTESIIHAVSKGLGLSIVSELAVKNCKHKDVIYVEVDGFTKRNFYLALKRGYTVSKTTESLVNFIKERYNNAENE